MYCGFVAPWCLWPLLFVGTFIVATWFKGHPLCRHHVQNITCFRWPAWDDRVRLCNRLVWSFLYKSWLNKMEQRPLHVIRDHVIRCEIYHLLGFGYDTPFHIERGRILHHAVLVLVSGHVDIDNSRRHEMTKIRIDMKYPLPWHHSIHMSTPRRDQQGWERARETYSRKKYIEIGRSNNNAYILCPRWSAKTAGWRWFGILSRGLQGMLHHKNTS